MRWDPRKRVETSPDRSGRGEAPRVQRSQPQPSPWLEGVRPLAVSAATSARPSRPSRFNLEPTEEEHRPSCAGARWRGRESPEVVSARNSVYCDRSRGGDTAPASAVGPGPRREGRTSLNEEVRRRTATAVGGSPWLPGDPNRAGPWVQRHRCRRLPLPRPGSGLGRKASTPVPRPGPSTATAVDRCGLHPHARNRTRARPTRGGPGRRTPSPCRDPRPR